MGMSPHKLQSRSGWVLGFDEHTLSGPYLHFHCAQTSWVKCAERVTRCVSVLHHLRRTAMKLWLSKSTHSPKPMINAPKICGEEI